MPAHLPSSDGPQYPSGGRARDRLLRHHRIAIVERFPAERCYEMPDDVVAEFLRLLRLNA